MQDIKAVNPKIQLQMPDGFSDPNANGAVGNGAYISVAGEPPTGLKGAGANFVTSFGKSVGATPNPYAAYGARGDGGHAPAISVGGGQRSTTTKASSASTCRTGSSAISPSAVRRHGPDARDHLQAEWQVARSRSRRSSRPRASWVGASNRNSTDDSGGGSTSSGVRQHRFPMMATQAHIETPARTRRPVAAYLTPVFATALLGSWSSG